MKTVSQLLSDLYTQDVHLWVEGESLRYQAAKSALTPELRAQITERKSEILSFLRENTLIAHTPASSIVKVSREGELPLSYAQQRLWFMDKFEPDSPLYNTPAALELGGALNLPALKQSFNEIVRRHESLRTTFRSVDGRPVQVIAPKFEVPLQLLDLDVIPVESRRQEALRLATEEAQRPFDLSQGPLIRVHLLRLEETLHILLVTMHHIVSDGWSMGVLIREITTLYAAYSNGHPSPLPELPVQYVDFAHWQREWLQGEVLETQLSYWKERLGGILPLLELPFDRPRPAQQTFRGASRCFLLPAPLAERLREISKREGLTLFMTLLAGFQVLLNRYTGQEDLILGTAIANRTRAEMEGLIGFFVNTLALRTDLSGDPTFLDLLRRVHRVTIDAYTHQDMPFEMLVERLQVVRDMSRSPVFEVMLVLQNAPVAELKLSGLSIRPIAIDSGVAKFDLALDMWEDESGINVKADYNTDLFEPETIVRMFGHFRRILEAAVANPGMRLSEFDLLSEVERCQLLIEWNATEAYYRKGVCIHDLFEEQVEKTPDSPALFFGESLISYKVLDERANQVAHYLRRLGVGPEVVVGICVERSVEMVIALMGVLKTGGAYLPLDPGYPRERLAFMIEDAEVAVLLTKEILLPGLSKYAGMVVVLDRESELIGREKSSKLYCQARADNLAYIIYTSGSTGKPKGVQIQHQGVCNLANAQIKAFRVKQESKVLQFAAFSFDASVSEIFMALLSGAALCLADRYTLMPGNELVHLLREQRITHVTLPPSVLALLPETEAFPELETIAVAGEACSADLVQRWSPRRRMLNAYGPTEATVCASMGECVADGTAPPIGRAMENTAIFILDDRFNPVPVGVVGELYIGGDGIARGYRSRPDLTAERFLPNPFAGSGERLYKTGDLGRYLPDGRIQYLGRVDLQVKMRGFRIELGEIENALLQHRRVRDAIVLARDDLADEKRVIAYLIAEQSESKTENPQEQAEHVSQWQLLYEDHYAAIHKLSRENGKPTISIEGWNSSYTGLPIPEHEMREWADRTTERVLALGRGALFEIGCGTGILLSRIAPNCRTYHGTDFAGAVIGYLSEQLPQLGLSNVTLAQKPANDFTGIDNSRFDLVILNSVVQYFPGIHYLLEVIRGALSSVKPGGHIFLGDLRNLNLSSAFQTSVQCFRAASGMSLGQLGQQVEKCLESEKELLIDPVFFLALQREFPRIRWVDILHKRGEYCNELSKYRYDVVLHVGDESVPQIQPEWVEWQLEGMTVATLRDRLAAGEELVALGRIPNAQLSEDVRLRAALEEAEVGTVGELRERARVGESGVEPEILCQLGEAYGYSAELRWSPDFESCFDLVFQRGKPSMVLYRWKQELGKEWGAYANNPLRGGAPEETIDEVRSFLQQFLPDFMIPTHFMVLPTFPLTPNGKVDRAALPVPGENRTGEKRDLASPRDLIELRLTHIWEELLQVTPIGVNENFFNLGGHSLLAVRLMSRIQKLFQQNIPVSELFRSADIASLARLLREGAEGAETSLLIPIQPLGGKKPFFCIHPAGGNVLCYYDLARCLGLDQPFYGLQGRGLDGKEEPHATVEEMAADYLKGVRTVQPDGPYLLGGWSLGGIVAFEMAQQLRAQGEEVALLALLDASMPKLGATQVRSPEFLTQIAQGLARIHKVELLLESTDLAKLTPEQRIDHLVEKARSAAGVFTDLGRHHVEVYLAHVEAGNNYQPRSYRGAIDFFLAQESAQNAPQSGWDQCCETLRLHSVPGSHWDLVENPNAATLAFHLRRCLGHEGKIENGKSDKEDR